MRSLDEKVDALAMEFAALRADLRWHVKWLSALSGFLGSATVVLLTWMLGLLR